MSGRLQSVRISFWGPRWFGGLKADAPEEIIQHGGHRTRLTARAISVDFRFFSDFARAREVNNVMALARRRLNLRQGVRMGLGVDRLDYTKGLRKRLWALDSFFTRYPQYRGMFTFVQVAVRPEAK